MKLMKDKSVGDISSYKPKLLWCPNNFLSIVTSIAILIRILVSLQIAISYTRLSLIVNLIYALICIQCTSIHVGSLLEWKFLKLLSYKKGQVKILIGI